MKIALVHDYLNQYGGGERVLETLMEIFPEAPVYTLFYDRKKTFNRFENRIMATSFLDKEMVWNNHRFFIPLMPIAANLLKLKDNYDLVISSSSGFGKGIGSSGKSFHVSYCHTPLRYAWEYYQYFDNWPEVLKLVASPAFEYLRWWDKRAGQKPNILLANSNFIVGKIKKYYNRDAEVVYPPVDMKVFYRDKKVKKEGYFLAVGRFIHYKKFDLIIQAFNKLNLSLIIVGAGPEEKNLKKIARSAKINFLPFAREDELRVLYNGAEALVFPQLEDFGLVAAEAQACGLPVIAFDGGGVREIVKDGVTGILFPYQTTDSLMMAVKKFLLFSFNEKVIRASAKKFSKVKFKNRILKIVNSLKLA